MDGGFFHWFFFGVGVVIAYAVLAIVFGVRLTLETHRPAWLDRVRRRESR